MELSEKLALLRRQKGITQEDMASALFVSRTAVSKWESGRGYPSIDSLKALSKFFSVSIDDLLSGEEILTIAEDDGKQKESRLKNSVFALLDLATALLFILPVFGQHSGDAIKSVSLMGLTDVSPWLKTTYIVAVSAVALWGILTLVLQNIPFGKKLSLTLTSVGALLFILSRQPYAAVLLFIFTAIKAILLIKKP